MAYLPDNFDLARRGGAFVDKILRGAKPGDLPIEEPTRYEFYVNSTTAQALGLNIPQRVSVQVTHWFQ
jgi:putative ABC transport system substrate-binding protein